MLKAKGDHLTSGFEAGRSQAIPVVNESHEFDNPEESGFSDQLRAFVDCVCDWLYPKGCRRATVELRAYTFVWFIRPDWLGNPSQVELAARLGVSKASFGKVVNQFRKAFGFYVSGMRGDEARKKFSEHAKRNAGKLAEARRKAHQGK